MKVLVLGANGGTGRLVVSHAIGMGYEVSVFVRHASLFYPAGVKVIIGDVLNPENVLGAMHCQDAVIECIGGNAPWMKQKLERKAMKNIVAAMKAAGTRRLLVISAMGVAESAKHSPWWYRFFVVPTFLRGIIADKKAMERIIRESTLDWIIARPPILTHGTASGNVKVLGPKNKGHMITRADLAMWLVKQLESE
ncbi:NAD(P)-dependent oxidoreductase [Arachidicoccus soli]|uniref:NAD-dependent epimerase/dehydratase family protein n=1 Tax=Arachidicoccus soli TaxID=2341117 RepID=A0A386HM46_9BACT|nr:NAD(P)H-binding protein [Arachidicoccus soli]AYD46571.1 NAD-dependent epimerase/dehydratase family protein [Arachidicoccus soli]